LLLLLLLVVVSQRAIERFRLVFSAAAACLFKVKLTVGCVCVKSGGDSGNIAPLRKNATFEIPKGLVQSKEASKLVCRRIVIGCRHHTHLSNAEEKFVDEWKLWRYAVTL